MPHLFIHHQQPLATHPHHSLLTVTTCSITAVRFTQSIHSTDFIGVLHRPCQITTTTTTGMRTIRCMANPRRVKMVAKQIRRELSDMLLTDKVLQYAVLPEAALGADRYLSSLTTISDVEVSADLQVVKVYVSVFGDDRGKEVAIAGLKSKAKYVRSVLGKRMKLRLTPEIRFMEDESIERGSRIIAILDRIKNEREIAEGLVDDRQQSFDQTHNEKDWQSDDPDDEGINYVNSSFWVRNEIWRLRYQSLFPGFRRFSFNC